MPLNKTMKKTYLLICASLMGCLAMAQSNDDAETRLLKNEISTNVLDIVIAGSLNVTYERMLNNNISVTGSATFFDTYGYYDAGYLESSSGVSLRGSLNFYVSKRRKFEGFYFYPLLKLRAGEITTDYEVFIINSQGNYISTNQNTYSIDGVAAGFGLGNKWIIQDKFSVTVFGEIARNLRQNLERENADLGNVEPRLGVNFGYRF